MAGVPWSADSRRYARYARAMRYAPGGGLIAEERVRRDRIAAASCGVAASRSSQPGGRNNHQSSGQDAVSVTAQIDTPIWQLPTLPSVPEYCRATPGEAVPSLRQPVSSTTHASGAITSIARRASRSRTGSTAQVEDE